MYVFLNVNNSNHRRNLLGDRGDFGDKISGCPQDNIMANKRDSFIIYSS